MSTMARPTARRSIGGAWLAVAGALLSFGGALTYFTVFARFPTLRDVPWVNLPLALAGVVLAALGASRAFRHPPRRLARALALLGLTGSLLFAGGLTAYVFWLSYQLPEATATASEMQIAPDVTLVDPSGAPVTIGQFRGTKLVVVFYRGFW